MDSRASQDDGRGIRLTRAQLLSAGGTLLLSLGALLTFAAQKFIEGAVDASFHRNIKELDLALERRSAFEDRVLTDRYDLALEFISRLDEVMMTYQRVRGGLPEPEGFRTYATPTDNAPCSGFEVVPLTEVTQDLSTYQLLLGEKLHGLLKERLTILTNAAAEPAFWPTGCFPGREFGHWHAEVEAPWSKLNARLLEELDAQFGLSQIRWDLGVPTRPAAEATPPMG